MTRHKRVQELAEIEWRPRRVEAFRGFAGDIGHVTFKPDTEQSSPYRAAAAADLALDGFGQILINVVT
jgi:hypothetical protein